MNSGGVIGIDFGTDTCIISQAKRGGIDIVMNEASARKTQSMVGFQGNERFLGAAAFPLSKSNYKNTARDFKRFLGRQFLNEDVQQDIKRTPNADKFCALENGQVGIKVNFNDKEEIFSMEQVSAMLLNKLRATVDKDSFPNDVVVSVPGWWNEAQRRAMLDSCSIAGFSCLRLLNDHTAAALSYGIYKSARNVFDAEKRQVVMFVDIGYSNTSVAIVGFVQGKLQVLSAAYDPNLGGRDFDDAILDKFASEFKAKHQLDVKTNPKSILKLQAVCEKSKQTLTPEGVNVAKANCEFLMNEIDFKSELSLEDFETMSTPLLERLAIPIQQALTSANLTTDEIESVEIIGGGTRPKTVKKAIATYMKLDLTKLNYGLSTTLNSDEAVARGCALNSAMLSPVFRVKEFNVFDVTNFPVTLSWDQTGVVDVTDEAGDVEMTEKNNSITLIEKTQSLPCTKRVTFKRDHDFDINAKYDLSPDAVENKFLPKEFDREFAKFKVITKKSKVVKDEEVKSAPTIRVDFSVDVNGLFSLSKVENLEEIIPKPKKETENDTEMADKTEKDPKDPKKEAKDAKNEAKNAKKEGKESKKEEKDSKKEETEPKEESKVEEPKPVVKKQFRKTALQFESSFVYGLKADMLEKYVTTEKGYIAADKEIEATSIAKNALEAYIYQYRDQVVGELKEFVTDAEKETFTSSLSTEETWLYDDGFDVAKEEYIKRLDKLKEMSNRFDIRKTEDEERPKTISVVQSVIDSYVLVVESVEEKYDHITPEERKKVKDKVTEVQDWLKNQMHGQEKVAKFEDPVLTSLMVKEQLDKLNLIARPVVNKKRPPPPKPKEEEKPKEKEAEAGAEKKDEDMKMDVEKDEKDQEKTTQADENGAQNGEAPQAAAADDLDLD